MAKDCKSCGWIDEFDGCNAFDIHGYEVPEIIGFIGCNKWEPKDEFSQDEEIKDD